MIPGSFEHNWTSISAAGTRATPPLYHTHTFNKPYYPSNYMLHHSAVEKTFHESGPEISRTTVKVQGTSPIPRNDLVSGHIYDRTCCTPTPRLDAQSSIRSFEEVNARHPDEVRHGLDAARYDQLSRHGNSAAYPILVSEDDTEKQPNFVTLHEVAFGERDRAPNGQRQIAPKCGVAEDTQCDTQTVSRTQSHTRSAKALVTLGAAKVGIPLPQSARGLGLDLESRKHLERYYNQQKTHPSKDEKRQLAELLDVSLPKVIVSSQRETS
jgi:hypothetical protein